MSMTRHCMSDRIRSAIESRIYDGSLRPGDRLVELDLAREFDTSQTPVREALHELESLRLVESIPYRGTRVRAISNREMAEAYSVRGILEQLAGESAAAVLKGNVGGLQTALEGIRAAADAGDGERYAAHNFEFHRFIVAASGNQVLLQTWKSLAFETRMRLSVARSSHADLVGRIAIHVEILDALHLGDGVLAGRLLRGHSQSLSEMWGRKPPEETAEN